MFRKAFATTGWHGLSAGTADRPSLIERVRASLAAIHLSIRAKILLALAIVVLMMGMINAVLLVQVLNYSRQYDAIIDNITTANSISGNIKPDIDTEMWRIVAGKTAFTQGNQYDIINDVNTKLQWMTDHTDSPESRIKLEGINRTMQTLTYEVNQMGQQIASGSTAAENEAVLENIRFVSAVVEKVVQDYALFEVNRPSSNTAYARGVHAVGSLLFPPVVQRHRFFGSGRLGYFQKHLHPD